MTLLNGNRVEPNSESGSKLNFSAIILGSDNKENTLKTPENKNNIFDSFRDKSSNKYSRFLIQL